MNKKTFFRIFESPYREVAIIGALLLAFGEDLLYPANHLPLIIVAGIGALPTAWQAVKATSERRISIDTFNFVALIASFASVEITSAMFIILMITSANWLEWYSESRTYDAVKQLLKLKPLSALREQGGAVTEVPSSEIKKGDIVVVKAGARIPIDGVVIFGSASVNEAPVTGESVPVQKIPGDHVFSATLNDSGVIKVRATRVGKDSTIEQMAELIREASKNKSHVEKLADRFAAIFLPIVGVIGAGTYLISRSLSMTAAVFLVACADDMAVAIPLAITASMGYAAKRGVIVKGGAWLDQLGKTKTLVLDKTGTLTYGNFKIRDVVIDPAVTEEQFWRMVGIAEKFSEHPIGRAIFRGALEKVPQIADPDTFETVKGQGTKAIAGADAIVAGNELFLQNEHIALPADLREKIRQMVTEYGQTVSLIGVNGVCIGAIAVADVPRHEAAATLRQLKKIGVARIVMFTGDNEAVARRVTEALGLDEYHAGMKPEEKLHGLEELEKDGVVVMVGDGINDAPSLARATVGVAMGKGGTAVAVEAADIVILTDQLERLPEMIDLGRRTSSVIYGDMIIWFVSNLAGFALVFTGIAGPALAAFYNFATDFLPLINSSRLFRRRD
ncbi:cation-translocating P-type ATPase [Patescibacteria group bacterium]|nr:cation-translocating P-type ATPase [Patescibacteria group bacterium]